MAKKGNGLFTLLIGAAAGAAAVFLSDKQNRRQAEQELQKVTARTKKLARKIEKSPTTKKVVRKTKKVAKVAVKEVSKQVKAQARAAKAKKLS